MEYDRTPPEAWERAIGRIAPPNPTVSWLKLVWEPGDRWQPVGRWMLWHMLPRKVLFPKDQTSVYAEIRRELEGPNPRGTGHYCADGKDPFTGQLWCRCLKKAKRYVDGPPNQFVDRLTWKLYRDTGCYGRRWWTVQGTKGGHRHRLNPTEQRVFHLRTGTKDTPTPGDLPYAEVDQRTIHAIVAFDKVRAWQMVSEFANRHRDQLDAEERAEAEQANAALGQWIETQVEAGWDAYGSAFRKAANDAAVLPGVKDTTDYEAADAAFVHDV